MPSVVAADVRLVAGEEPEPAGITEPIEAFARWMEQFRDATPALRETLLPEGMRLVVRRRSALRELIEHEPEEALSAALSWEQRQLLPVDFHPFIERRINDIVRYEVTVASDFSAAPVVERHAIVHGVAHRAFVHGLMIHHPSSPALPINGIAIDDALALAESPVRVLDAAEADAVRLALANSDPVCAVSGEPADARQDETLVEIAGETEFVCGSDHVRALQELAANNAKQRKTYNNTDDGPTALDNWNQGPKRVLFMRVNFPDDLSDPISEAAAHELMNNVNTWIVANSYGSASMVTTVTPLLTLPGTKAFYAEIGDSQLLADARAVAKAAGYDTADFDLDAVRFTNVPGYGYGGKAYVRGKGCWLQSSSVGVACHEFGHNYGLWHANYWNSGAASAIGHGSHSEYGDSFDTMGSAGAGDRHFNANHRNMIDWLGDSYVRTVEASGNYRLHAFDVPSLTAGRFYGIKVRKDYDRDYWLEARRLFASNTSLQNGALVRWDPWASSGGGSHLIDSTPGSPAGNSSKDDAALVLGRTFADPGAGIYVTPVALKGSGVEKSLDIAVQLGPFPDNEPPTIAVHAAQTSVAAGAPVEFTAVAHDPDGDSLAYDWDFGDLTFGFNSSVITNSWSSSGDYVVRCRVSDMKGGVASAHVVIRVGTPNTHVVSGRVLDSTGQPLEGVRVHNGSSSAGSYRGGFTDSDGNFVISRLSSGNHTFTATLYGYTFSNAGGWSNPVTVGPDRAGIDFTSAATPVVGWEIMDGDIGETGLNSATLRLTRTGPTTAPLTVKYKRSGTATYNSDYVVSPAPSGSAPYLLTIPAGADSLEVTVTPNQDTAAEGPETAILLLDENAAYVIGWRAEAILELQDDEAPSKPTVYLSSSADNRATESGNDTGAFTVNRSGNKTGDIRVHYSVGGTATPAIDFVPPSGSVVLPAGHTTMTVTFGAIDDTLVEGDETVEISLVPDVSYTASGSPAVVTIQDDDPPTVQLLVTDDLAVEGGSATAKIVFQRTGDISTDLAVEYSSAGTATSGADYNALAGMQIIPAGAASATLTVTVVNDTITEGDETVAVVITADAAYNVGPTGSAVIIIQDNEIPTITLAASDSTATEGGGDEGVFTISRSSSSSGALAVSIEVSGNALPGDDYTALPPSVVIPDGATSVTLMVVPADDALREADEKVTLRLVNTPNYNAGTTGPVSITVKDNDTAGSRGIQFESAASIADESKTSIRLPVVLSASSSAAVTVDYNVIGGTATGAGTDFTLASGTLTMPANETLATINFSLANDSLAENPETILIQLSNPSGADLDVVTVHTLTIRDDDAAVVSVVAEDAAATEGGDTGRVRISRMGSTSAPTEVLLQISGTASSPTDFAALPTQVTIPAGSASIALTIQPVDDTTDEIDETVLVRVTSVAGGRVGSPATATVTITDNDDANNAPVVSVLALDNTTTERLEDVARLQLTREGETHSSLTVYYSLAGSASNGADFATLPGSITIPVGQSSVFLDIQALADGVSESPEELILTLLADSGYALNDANVAVLRVLDSPFMRWQFDQFTVEQIALPAVINPDADPDGDGLNNFVEYACNRNPNSADGLPLLAQTLEHIDGTAESLLVVSYQRRLVRPDIAYTLGVGGELTGILDDSFELESPTVSDDGNGITETVRIRILAPTGHYEQRFVRLKIARQ